jgi:putative transcriptional regulator
MATLAPASDPLDALLAGYAAGTLPRPLFALVGAHLELSEKNRAYVCSLEAALASRIDCEPARPIRARAERLTAILDGPEESRRSAQPACASGDPRALRHFLGASVDELAFKSLLPGIREHRLPRADGLDTVLYRIRPGKRMPQHTHHGSEITLVLRGSFVDAEQRFARGDIAITDEHVDHLPVAGEEGECVCFAVLDAPLKLTGFFGRLVNPFLPH